MNAHYPDCSCPENCACETRRYTDILIWGLIATAVEIVGGFVSGSVALFADAAHVLADNAAVILSIVIAFKARNAPQARQLAIRANGGRISAIMLFVVALFIAAGACKRLFQPHNIDSLSMFVSTVVGGFINFLQHRKLHGVDASDAQITHDALQKHILSDLIQSIGVCAAAIAIAVTGWHLIDPLVTFWICYRMMRWSWEIWKQSAAAARNGELLGLLNGHGLCACGIRHDGRKAHPVRPRSK